MVIIHMRSIEATGKSVDAAIFNGLAQLGVSIDEVSIDIIQTETKGILGIGAKAAIVRLTEKPPEEVIVPDFSQERRRDDSRAARGSGGSRNRERRPYHDRQRRSIGGERSSSGGEGSAPAVKSAKAPAHDVRPSFELRERPEIRKPAPVSAAESEIRKPAPASAAEPDSSEPASAPSGSECAAADEQRPAGSERRAGGSRQSRSKPESAAENSDDKQPAAEINYTEEAAADNPAADFIKNLISYMGVDARVLAAVDEGCIHIRIDSEAMGVLIGHRGETLDAMQYLTGLVVNRDRRNSNYIRINLDTEDYREKRAESLVRLARKVASQVKSTGRARALEPMNPYERRILHSALQGNPYVTTHSEGEDPNRRVVIVPRRRGR